MELYNFGPEVGIRIGKFESVGAVHSKVLRLESGAQVSCFYIDPGGKIGNHQAATRQLFLVVQGQGWVKSGRAEPIPIRAGQAAFWEEGEWHESGTETGMMAVVIEGDDLEPGESMPSPE